MGDDQEQSGLEGLVFFLDENHCRNRHMIAAIEQSGFRCEGHHHHFAPVTADVDWLPVVARRGWSLVTTDARIRRNLLETQSIRANRARMFYFSRNDSSGAELGAALRKALPHMATLVRTCQPPFTASITKAGEVTLRDTFSE